MITGCGTAVAHCSLRDEGSNVEVKYFSFYGLNNLRGSSLGGLDSWSESGNTKRLVLMEVGGLGPPLQG